MSRRKATWRWSPLVLGALLVMVLMVAGCGGEHQFNGTAYDPPVPAPAITGINWDGRAFNLSDLKGKVTLVFFGYTHCPDVCPLTLAELADMVKTLGDQRQEVAVVFGGQQGAQGAEVILDGAAQGLVKAVGLGLLLGGQFGLAHSSAPANKFGRAHDHRRSQPEKPPTFATLIRSRSGHARLLAVGMNPR